MNPAIFLDRDGVINEVVLELGKPNPPSSLEELRFLPGVIEATHTLSNAGFKIIIVTNQPDVSTGKQTRAVVESMNRFVTESMPIDSIRVCYHLDEDRCDCRKPLAGMLLDAAKELDLDLSKSYMIGDRWKDIEAGKNAFCRTIWIESRYREKKPDDPWAVVSSLLEASQIILSQTNFRV